MNTEKRDHLSPHELHTRLRIIEVVVFLSLVLNLVQGYITMHTAHRMNNVQEQTGVR